MTNCSICLTEIIDKILTTTCQHTFHVDCINQWLIQSMTCPLCRQSQRGQRGHREHRELNLTEDKLIVIVGRRGSGKTTLLNDYLRHNHSLFSKIIYISPLKAHDQSDPSYIHYTAYSDLIIDDLLQEQSSVSDARALLLIDDQDHIVSKLSSRLLDLCRINRYANITVILTAREESILSRSCDADIIALGPQTSRFRWIDRRVRPDSRDLQAL